MAEAIEAHVPERHAEQLLVEWAGGNMGKLAPSDIEHFLLVHYAYILGYQHAVVHALRATARP
jgi:hypothetical protein